MSEICAPRPHLWTARATVILARAWSPWALTWWSAIQFGPSAACIGPALIQNKHEGPICLTARLISGRMMSASPSALIDWLKVAASVEERPELVVLLRE